MDGNSSHPENGPEERPEPLVFVPLPKFRGRRNGYLVGNEVYLSPELYARLMDPSLRHETLSRLTILDVEAYFSQATAARMKADIAAQRLKMEEERKSG
jgi:hypothetical protein